MHLFSCTSRVAFSILFLARHTLYIKRHTFQVTDHTPYAATHASHIAVTRSSVLLPDPALQKSFIHSSFSCTSHVAIHHLLTTYSTVSIAANLKNACEALYSMQLLSSVVSRSLTPQNVTYILSTSVVVCVRHLYVRITRTVGSTLKAPSHPIYTSPSAPTHQCRIRTNTLEHTREDFVCPCQED
jgi:hypothetical protein